MSLTKSDKAEIKKMIREALMEPQDTAVELPTWEPKVLKKSKMLGIEIASENYWEIDNDGKKKEHFTWDEAMGIENKLHDGWRLPTRSEWAVLVEEFGVDDNGELDKDILMQNLSMNYTGYRNDGSINNPSDSAGYWSRTAGSSVSAYHLAFHAYGDLYPQDYDYKSYGFAVRLVRDMEVKNEN